MTDQHAAEEPRRDGAAISDDMLADRDAVAAGTMSRADYEAACARNHTELDELFAENRAQQDVAMRRCPKPAVRARAYAPPSCVTNTGAVPLAASPGRPGGTH